MKVSPFLWSIANGVATRALTFVFFVVIGRLITPADFGVMALALAVALLIDTLIEQGLGDALVQRDELEDDHAGSVFIYQVTIAAAIATLLWVSAPYIAAILGEPRLTDVLPWIGLASLLNSLGFVKQALFRRELQFKILAIRNFIATSVGGLIGFWYAYHGAGVMSLVVMHVANAALGVCVLWVASKHSFALRFNFASLRSLLAFSKAGFGTRVIEVVAARLDQVLIGQYFGASVLGYYALAMRLYEILIQTTAAPIAEVAYPLFSRLQNDRQGMGQAYLRLVQYVGGLTIPLFVGAAVTAPIFVPTFFGAQWQPATTYVVMILAVGALNSINTYNDVLFGAIGRPDLRLKFAIASLVLWLCSAAVLLPFGPIYAAITWGIRSLMVYPFRLNLALRLTDTSPQGLWGIVLPPILACGAMVGVVALVERAWPPETAVFAQMAVEVALGGGAYILALHLLGSPLPRRIRYLKRSIAG